MRPPDLFSPRARIQGNIGSQPATSGGLYSELPTGKTGNQIIVEESDIATSAGRWENLTCRRTSRLSWCRNGTPQTKPRALNYALQFCRGSLLTIYDAEDVPEPNQLREVARKFSARR